MVQSTSPHQHNCITRTRSAGCRDDPAPPGSADAAWGEGLSVAAGAPDRSSLPTHLLVLDKT